MNLFSWFKREAEAASAPAPPEIELRISLLRDTTAPEGSIPRGMLTLPHIPHDQYHHAKVFKQVLRILPRVHWLTTCTKWPGMPGADGDEEAPEEEYMVYAKLENENIGAYTHIFTVEGETQGHRIFYQRPRGPGGIQVRFTLDEVASSAWEVFDETGVTAVPRAVLHFFDRSDRSFGKRPEVHSHDTSVTGFPHGRPHEYHNLPTFRAAVDWMGVWRLRRRKDSATATSLQPPEDPYAPHPLLPPFEGVNSAAFHNRTAAMFEQARQRVVEEAQDEGRDCFSGTLGAPPDYKFHEQPVRAYTRRIEFIPYELPNARIYPRRPDELRASPFTWSVPHGCPTNIRTLQNCELPFKPNFDILYELDVGVSSFLPRLILHDGTNYLWTEHVSIPHFLGWHDRERRKWRHEQQQADSRARAGGPA